MLGVVGEAVAVEPLLTLVDAVGQAFQRGPHGFRGGIAGIADAAEIGGQAVLLQGFSEQAGAEFERSVDGLDVGQHDRAETGVVENEAERRPDRLAGAVEQCRRQDQTVFVEVGLGDFEPADGPTAPVEHVRADRHRADELAGVENGSDETDVVEVRPHPVGVVHDDDVARDHPVDAVFLKGDADRVRDGTEEQRDRLGHRRHREVQRGRTRHRGGDVRRLADLRRERIGDELAADVLHDVAETAGNHCCGESVALVGLFELRVAEVSQRGPGRASSFGLGRHLPHPFQALWLTRALSWYGHWSHGGLRPYGKSNDRAAFGH